MLIFLEYPKCSTCQKAKKWLDENKIKYQSRHIVEQNPTIEELQKWIALSNKTVKNFFNTSGLIYKNMNLKDKLQNMSENEQIELLASNGMLIKRPLLIGTNFALTGFRPEEWLKKV